MFSLNGSCSTVFSYEPSDNCRVGPQAELFSGSRLRAEEQAKIATSREAVLDQSKAAHSEISRGDIQRAPSFVLYQ